MADNDLRDCWDLVSAPLPPEDPALDEQRARLLGLLAHRVSPLRFVFPIIRSEIRPYPPGYEPLRRNIDYTAVGRKTFLLTEPLETPTDAEK